MIQVSDFLDFLVGRSGTPSNLGAQLERMRDGTTGLSDPFRARDEIESGLIRTANLIRCVDQFAERQELSPKGQEIERVNRDACWSEGALALGVLRSYHEWSSQSQERGLVEIYRFLAKVAPRGVKHPPAGSGDLLQVFREGKANRCRFMAAECYADALIAVQHHVRVFNDKHSDG